jgi:hypothetical protein
MSMMDCIIKYVGGHLEVYDRHNNWIQSADNDEELEQDIRNYVEQQMNYA